MLHHKTNNLGFASSKDSDQPGPLASLIRVFTVGMKNNYVLSYPLSTSEDSSKEALYNANENRESKV